MKKRLHVFSRIQYAALILLLQACSPALERSQPNFIIILTDDQGYGDLGCYGSDRVVTPNIDRMAEEGLLFTNFYAQTVCGPSRAALMSGCYPIRVGEPGNRKHQHTILHTEEVTMAEKLQDLGYATACIGKWHLGLQDKNSPSGWDPSTMPNGQGFDYYYGTPLYNGYTVYVDETPFRSKLIKNSEVVEDSILSWDFCTSAYSREAIDWMERNKDRPFFLYLSHNMPHIPLGAGEGFKGKNPGDPYADAIEEIDWSTGEILEYLEREGLAPNTIVFFFSDNGPWIESTRAMKPGGDAFIPPEHSGEADPLRGYKMLSWDGGSRVPCLAWSPGRFPEGRVLDQLLTSMDLYPTFIKMAGGESDTGRDGEDISQLLLEPGTYEDAGRAYYYYVYTHLQAVRQGPWKLVLPRPEFPEWTGFSGRFYGDGVEGMELYNLEEDVGETENLASRNPEQVASLMELVQAARLELGDYDRLGRDARFFENTLKRPGMQKYVRQ